MEKDRQRREEDRQDPIIIYPVQHSSIYENIRNRFYEFNKPPQRILLGAYPFILEGTLSELDVGEDEMTGESYFYDVESGALYPKKELGEPCPDRRARLEACFNKMKTHGSPDEKRKLDRYKEDFLAFFTEVDAVVYEATESIRQEWDYWNDLGLGGIFDALIVRSYDFWFRFDISWTYRD